VYRISPGGERRVVAGTGSAGFSGDGGAAEGAALDTPRGLAIDAEDNLFIADTGNHRVRRVNGRGIIRTIAGTDAAAAPQAAMARYADADKAPLLSPISLQHDRDGSVFVTESACATGGRKPTVWVLKQKM
jgi:sugar lactone lactonase YvrE